MKKLKPFFLGSLFFASLLCFSCQTSNAFRVPGESGLIVKNISSEYFAIAEAYSNLKNYDKAIVYYKLAMKNKSLRLNAYYKLARVYALSKDYENASKCYKDLLALDPENKDLQLSLAYVKAMSGKTDEAILDYQKLSQKYPEDSSVLENYINMLLFANQFEEAQTQCVVLEEKFPDNANLKTLKDKIEEGLAKNTQKEAELQPAVSQTPEAAERPQP